ncbi:MAG: phosphatase PAP2 family protein [Phycisphaerales bacterium]|nr:phosphatase PAP2 family protein [Planctomycetota bacterium]
MRNETEKATVSPWRPLGLIALGFCLIPLDGTIRQFFSSVRLGGDVLRELELLQQFGDLATTVLAMVIILMLDPLSLRDKARRLADWGLAYGVVSAAAHAIKVLVGRPRPRFEDPLHAAGPLGQYPVVLKNGRTALIHSWDYSSGVASDLWSMPSSHAAAAGCMAAALAILYPRLGWFCAAMATIVCIARVVLGAHYASDVLVGVGLGWWIGGTVVSARWGSGLIDFLRHPRAGSVGAESRPVGS